jgi:hypothetical protein
MVPVDMTGSAYKARLRQEYWFFQFKHDEYNASASTYVSIYNYFVADVVSSRSSPLSPYLKHLQSD